MALSTKLTHFLHYIPNDFQKKFQAKMMLDISKVQNKLHPNI
jgi:hypothetical protein